MIARRDTACFVSINLPKETLTACTITANSSEDIYRKIPCGAREQVREFRVGLPRPRVVVIETVGFKKSRLWIAKTAGKKASPVAVAGKIMVLMWLLVR